MKGPKISITGRLRFSETEGLQFPLLIGTDQNNDSIWLEAVPAYRTRKRQTRIAERTHSLNTGAVLSQKQTDLTIRVLLLVSPSTIGRYW